MKLKSVTKVNKPGFVLSGLLLGILITALDNTIVATAMGSIVNDLGGLDKFIWVTSAYLITEMAGIPIFGKLSDMYGRKRLFILGLIIFLIGSVLCGTAESIEQLSIYRAIQGLGGGALFPIAFTIITDLYPPEKRGKMMGLLGAVYGTSNLFGPLFGAYITEYISWNWIFYINLPIGMIALFFIMNGYRETFESSKQRIDWSGATVLIGAILSLMFALELGGKEYAWDSGVILGLFAASLTLIILFLFIERKAEEPIVSFALFRDRLYLTSTFAAMMHWAAFIVAVIYIPIFVQGVMGGSATNSGLILIPMTVGSVVSAQIGGWLTIKYPYRSIMLFPSAMFAVSLYFLTTLNVNTSYTTLVFFMLLTGFSIGFSFSVFNLSAIHSVKMKQRGQANSTMAFIRTLGMTVGITIFGIIQRNSFSARMNEVGAGNIVTNEDPRMIMSAETRAQIPEDVLNSFTEALSSSITQTFTWGMVPAVLALIFVSLMGKERIQPKLNENISLDNSITKNQT